MKDLSVTVPIFHTLQGAVSVLAQPRQRVAKLAKLEVQSETGQSMAIIDHHPYCLIFLPSRSKTSAKTCDKKPGHRTARS